MPPTPQPIDSTPPAQAPGGAVTIITAQERDRAKIPDRHKWDLTPIYATDDAWRAAKEELKAALPALRVFKGTLASGPASVAQALELSSLLQKALARASVYASMMSDQDTRVSLYQGMQQEMAQIAADLSAETSYIEPEILQMDPEVIASYIEKEPRLAPYRVYLDDIERRRAHTLSDPEEKILAAVSVVATAPSTIYGLFSDADFPYPTVTLSDGSSVKLDSAAFSVQRSVANRSDRQTAMSAFFGALGQYRATFGAALSAQVQSDIFYARARKYDIGARCGTRRARTCRAPCTCASSTASTGTCRPFTAT